MARVLAAAALVLCTVAAVLLSHVLYQSNAPAPAVGHAQIRHEGGRLLTLRDGRKLEYFDSETPGPVLLAIHGGLTTGWGFQGPARPAGVRIISPTFPGFGASSSRNGRTILSFGDDVLQLLDHLDIQRFVLAGVSWGGPHSAAVALAAPGRVAAWLLLAPVVPTMPDFPGWTALMPDPAKRLLHHYLLPTPLLNRAIIKYLMAPIFAQPYTTAVWAQLAGRPPHPSFLQMPAAAQEHLFRDMGRSIRWNLDGLPDLAETSVKPLLHLDYALLGSLLGSTPVHIHVPRNDTLVHPSCSQYMSDRLAAGGASDVQLIPSEGEEGHFYAVSHFGPALQALLAQLPASSSAAAAASPQPPNTPNPQAAPSTPDTHLGEIEGGDSAAPSQPVPSLPTEAGQHTEL